MTVVEVILLGVVTFVLAYIFGAGIYLLISRLRRR